MADRPHSDRRPAHARYHARRRQRSRRIATLQARVAALESQAGAYRALQAAAPTERLNTLLAVSAALLGTHPLAASVNLIVQRAVQLFPGASGALLFLAKPESGALQLSAASSGLAGGLTLQAGRGLAGRA